MRIAVCGAILILLGFFEFVQSDNHEDLLRRLDILEERLDRKDEEIDALKQQLKLKTRDGSVDVEACAYREYWGTIASKIH